jgi:hypothetical protein
MTQPGTYEIGVDPAAPRPSVGFRLDVPDEFTEFDLDPSTSDGWVERLLAERSAAFPAAAAQRGRARQVLQAMIARQREAEVFLAAFLVKPGPRAGEMVGGSLTLAWRQFTGGVQVAGLWRYFADEEPGEGEDVAARSVEEVALPRGAGVRVRTRQRLPVPLTSRREETVIVQHLVPVPAPADDWLAVLTMSTPDLAGADDFHALADRVAASLDFLDATGLPLPGRPPSGTIGRDSVRFD